MNDPFTHSVLGEQKKETKFLVFPPHIFFRLVIGGGIGFLLGHVSKWHGFFGVVAIILITLIIISIIAGMIKKPTTQITNGAGLYYDTIFIRKIRFKFKKHIYGLAFEKEES